MNATPGTDTVPGRLRKVGALAFQAGFRYRVIGLAAESAFFALLSLPPMLFALVGALGFVAAQTDPSTIFGLRDDILGFAGQFLTRTSIESILAPTIDEVISSRRSDVVSIGFLIALWTGSRAIAVFVETVSLMYGYQGRRSIVRQRALSFALFLLLLVIGIVLIPLILTGPSLIGELLPERVAWLAGLYWPVVTLLSIGLVTTMFYLAVPERHAWHSHLPGALWTMVMWLVGSQLLRLVLSFASDTTSIYGPLAAPIAVLLWLYLTSLAVLIGAAINASVAEVFPRFAGVRPTPRRAEDSLQAAAGDAGDDLALEEQEDDDHRNHRDD